MPHTISVHARALLYIWMVIALAACGGDDPTTPPVDDPKLVQATIDADGGALVSGDGVLTLEFRPFAFDAPEQVSIETLVGKDAAYRITSTNPSPAVGVLARWELGALSAPADDRYRHAFVWLKATSEEAIPAPAAQRLRLDGESDEIQLSGELIYLDLTLSVEQEALVVGMGPVPLKGLAGTRLFVEAEFDQSSESTVSATTHFADRGGELPQPQPLVNTASEEGPLAILESGVALSYRKLAAAYRWNNVPAGRFWAELRFSELQVGGLALDGGWTFELFLPVRGEESIPDGDVFAARTEFPTALIIPPFPWGPFSEGNAVGVVGSDGVPFLDVETGVLLNGDLIGLESILGGVAMSNVSDAASYPSYLLEALLLYGSGGAGLSSWAWGMGEFTPPVPIEQGAEVVDAAPYGGDPSSGGVCYAMPSLNEVGFVEPNTIGDRFERSELRIDVSLFPNTPGPVVSAYRREFGGEVLVLCDGQPGALYLWDPADSSAVEIGRVGDDPAQVRGMGTVCVVSNFTSGTISTVSWPLGGVPALRESLIATGGPRGMELRPLNAQYELVSVGFTSDQRYTYLLSATGAMISIANELLPDGCYGPSAAVFAPGDLVLVAGFTSSTIARFAPVVGAQR